MYILSRLSFRILDMKDGNNIAKLEFEPIGKVAVSTSYEVH